MDTTAIPTAEFREGVVKSFNVGRGFGFILDETGSQLYFHILNVVGNRTLSDGQKVTYRVGTWKGRPQAENVQLIETSRDVVL